MFKDQEFWLDLVKEIGEPAARELLIKKLRAAANQIEKGRYPDIFGCWFQEPGALPVETISVTLSGLWPG